MKIYKLFHETEFEYTYTVSYSHNIAKLKPVNNDVQTLQEYEVKITPEPQYINDYTDYFANHTAKIFIKNAHDKLNVTANSIVMIDEEKIHEKIESYRKIELSLEQLQESLANDDSQKTLYLKQFLFASPLIPFPNEEILEYANISFNKFSNLFLVVEDLMNRIFNDFEFVSGFSDITTSIETVFKEKKGVCQDFASLSISILRACGIPTRYASGYIQTIPPEGKEKLFGVDASHAWISVYLGHYGWVDFDPTNNKIVNEEYILLGYGRDYNDITPLKGVVQGSGTSEMTVKVDVSLL